MKTIKKNPVIAILTLSLMAIFFLSSQAKAATPTWTAVSTGDGDTIRITVQGDPVKSVLLYYYKDGLPQLNFLGTTDSSGAFTIDVSTASLGVSKNTAAHVIVNNQNSVDIAWPFINAGTLYLNPTSIILPVGQTKTLTAYNNGTNLLYLLSNSNPPIANVNISGSQITITAINYGATIITVCSQSSTNNCASTYVNVQNTGALPLGFSQSNIGVTAGQSITDTVYGGSGNYLVLNNSNTGVIQASVSGSIVALNAVGSSGFAAVTVCTTDMNSCGIINANIGVANSSNISLSQSAPSMTVGQSLNITITGGVGGDYSIFSNSSTSTLSTSLSGSTLTLNALAGGMSQVTVCSSGGSCAAVTATVINTGYNNGGKITLSQNNLWLMVGQVISITISGGSSPYNVPARSDGIVNTSINNTILTVTGVKNGSTLVNVCSADGGCTSLSVLVNGTNSGSTISLSQNTVTVTAGYSQAISIYGNGNYYASNNTAPNIATVSINGASAIVNGLNAGSNQLTICQNDGQCVVLSINVLPVTATTTPTTTNTTPATTTNPPAVTVTFKNNDLVRDQEGRIYIVLNGQKQKITSLEELREKYARRIIINAKDSDLSLLPNIVIKFKFVHQLALGSSGADVTELQKRLAAEGFFKDKINGKYLSSTVVALKKYQKAKGIRQTGNLGPLTIAALNK